jgi:hypothetical protein
MQWRTPRVASLSRAACSTTQTQVTYTDGTVIIESLPSVFAEELASVQPCPRETCYAELKASLGDRSGAGLSFLVPPAVATTTVPNVHAGDTYTGRIAVTEFFSNRKAYADPEQFDDSSGCALPTRQDLYVVRFIDSDADAQGSSVRVPLVFEVDQMSGLLAPLARIERSLVDDDFLTLDGWNVVNSTSRPNHWQVGGLDGQSSAYVTVSPGNNDYVPGSAMNLSICHLYRDIYFPSDSPSGAVHLHLRILGNGSLAEPTNDAQDFAAVHLLPTSYQPQADIGVGFENRLGGTMLLNRISGADYVTERLELQTNVIRGSLAGHTYRLVVSFHSGSGLTVQPYALALSRLMVAAAVEPRAQPPVRISPCTQAQ